MRNQEQQNPPLARNGQDPVPAQIPANQFAREVILKAPTPTFTGYVSKYLSTSLDKYDAGLLQMIREMICDIDQSMDIHAFTKIPYDE